MWKLICAILICCVFILGVIKVIQMIKNKQNSTYSIVLFSISLITVTTVFLMIVDRLNGGNRIDYFSEQNLIKSLGTIDMSWRDNSTQTPKASMPKIIHRTYKNYLKYRGKKQVKTYPIGIRSFGRILTSNHGY